MVPPMKSPRLATPETARPLAPIAVLLVTVVCAHALIVGCGGGGTKESGNASTEASSSTTTPAQTAPPADTGAVASDPIAHGKQVYMARCALCHGPEGKGDGPAAAGLNPKPRNHTDGTYMNSRTDDQLLQVIRNGKGGMPAWGAVLSDQEIHDVLKYVRTLAK
jgi:mono/diheme cytochrome c family protein